MGQNDCLAFGPPKTVRVIRLSWIVGCILSAIGYGALLVVGYACYVGLRRRDSQSGGHSRVNKHKALIIYVIFTLVLTTVTEIVEIILTLKGVLNDVCFSQNLVPQSPYVGHFTIPLWLINVLLSVIDCSNAVQSQENPFVHLDALYHEILSSIPSTVWPTTKQLLGVAIYGGAIRLRSITIGFSSDFLTIREMSILLGITPSTVYASLDKIRSILKISEWKVAHKKPLTFLHASFSDYLKDSKRSGDFYVGSEEDIKEDMILRLLEIWNMCCGHDIAILKLAWHQYCSELTGQSSSRAIEKLHTNLFRDTTFILAAVVPEISCSPMESPVYTPLRKLHMRKFYYIMKEDGFLWYYVRNTLSISPEPCHKGFLREVHLKDLEFGHLDWKEMRPAHSYFNKKGVYRGMRWPRSSAELTAFVSDLKSLQENSPELEVRIIGGVPKERVAAFKRPLKEGANDVDDFMYYVLPYPE